MHAARLIVCEDGWKWSFALRAALGADARWVVACGLRETCEASLARWPASLVAIEASPPAVGDLLEWIAQVGSRYPQLRVVALAGDDFSLPEANEAEAGLLEAGATAVFRSPRESGSLAKLARRHFGRFSRSSLGFAQQVWMELPWSEAARR